MPEYPVYEHNSPALTVGQLRDALAGLPDHMQVVIVAPSEPGRSQDHELIVTGVGHLTVEERFGGFAEQYLDHRVAISADYASGEWAL